MTQEDVNKAAREAVKKEYFCESCAWKNDCYQLCGGENTAFNSCESPADSYEDGFFDCCECPVDLYEDGFKAGANFALGNQENDADIVVQGWVCRDESGRLCFYQNEPKREEYDLQPRGYWTDKTDQYIDLPPNLFPGLTWESDPIEITIKRKKKNL